MTQKTPAPARSLTRSELLAQSGKLRYAQVLLSFGVMRIRSISDLDRIAYELAETNDEGEIDIQQVARRRARLVCLCGVDDEGAPLFLAKDIEAIVGWDTSDLRTAYLECSRHCGINDAEVERFAKNSARVLDSGSP